MRRPLSIVRITRMTASWLGRTDISSGPRRMEFSKVVSRYCNSAFSFHNQVKFLGSTTFTRYRRTVFSFTNSVTSCSRPRSRTQ